MHTAALAYFWIAALAATASGCTSGAASADTPDGSSIVAAVATQAQTEFALWSLVPRPDSSEVWLESGPRLGDSVSTVRAWLSMSHWHAYQFIVADGNAIAVGGFESPDMRSAVSVLAPARWDSSTVSELTEKLAVLADDAGGVQYFFPWKNELAPAPRLWEKAKQPGWPRDTVVAHADGSWSATITILSRETRSYTQHWMPVAYSFVFRTDGQLGAWSRRVGDPVPGSGIPVEPTPAPWDTAGENRP